jgi:hypothetical protein
VRLFILIPFPGLEDMLRNEKVRKRLVQFLRDNNDLGALAMNAALVVELPKMVVGLEVAPERVGVLVAEILETWENTPHVILGEPAPKEPQES